MSTRSVSLVVPVFNGERFIRESIATLDSWLAGLRVPCELVVVDDGSTDATWREVEGAFEAANLRGNGAREVQRRALRTTPNRGKGHAVRRGLLAATGDYRVFLDADLTYPVENLKPLLAALSGGADLAIGSRTLEGSRYVMAPSVVRRLYTRHAMGRIFNFFARKALLEGMLDTQAGLKGMSRAAAEQLLPRLSLERFSFDVELLYLARRHGFVVEEVPVTCVWWEEPPTLELAGAGLEMLFDLVRIRLRARQGVYDAPPAEAATDVHDDSLASSS